MQKVSDIKIVFLSGTLTPHQIPFCDYMYNLNSSFRFIQMINKGEDWEAKGTVIKKSDYPYLLQYDKSRKVQEEIDSADILLTCLLDKKILKKRFQQKKINVVYLERFYKEGIYYKNFIKVLIGTYIHHGVYQKYKPYLFCAGAYCAGDASIFGNYKKRMFKWGYFPEHKKQNIAEILSKKEDIILWVGRMIDWKHPDDVLSMAENLLKEKRKFKIRMIGDGDMYEYVKRIILEKHIDNIELLGSQNSSEVHNEMMKAAVFISTSDYKEGWGVVLNEAMEYGCAVIASHAAGSSPFLINDHVNGLIYQSGNIDQLTGCCKYYFDNIKKREQFAQEAYKTIDELWNAQIAAQRFYEWSEALLKNELIEFEDGPCSKAYPILQRDMYAFCKRTRQ